jgi:hypothetical protein
MCPVQVSPELRDLICQLLDKDALKRMDVQGALQVSTQAHMQLLEAFVLINPLALHVAQAQPRHLVECFSGFDVVLIARAHALRIQHVKVVALVKLCCDAGWVLAVCVCLCSTRG